MANTENTISDETLENVTGGYNPNEAPSRTAKGTCPFCRAEREIAYYSGARAVCQTCHKGFSA